MAGVIFFGRVGVVGLAVRATRRRNLTVLGFVIVSTLGAGVFFLEAVTGPVSKHLAVVASLNVCVVPDGDSLPRDIHFTSSYEAAPVSWSAITDNVFVFTVFLLAMIHPGRLFEIFEWDFRMILLPYRLHYVIVR